MKPYEIQYRHIHIIVLLLALLFGGCSRMVVPLKKDEYLLYEQKIKGTVSIDSEEELEPFYRQKTNRRIFILPFMPYLYAYFLGEEIYKKQKKQNDIKLEKLKYDYDILLGTPEPEDNKKAQRKLQRKLKKLNDKIKKTETLLKEGNWLMRSVGEKPSIFDSTSVAKTAEQMQLYLRQKGFFHSKVTPEITENFGMYKYVTYQVHEGNPHKIRNVLYEIKDSLMRSTVEKNAERSLLKPNQNFEENKLSAERDRVYEYLKQNGYFDFSKQYIFFEIDSNQIEEYWLDVKMVIESPLHNFKKFKLANVTFITNLDTDTTFKKETIHQKIKYIEFSKRYSKRVLGSRIYLKPDTTYNHHDAIDTQKALASLNMFKFINFVYDTTGGVLSTKIYSSSYPKYDISFEGGVNVIQSLPGPFVMVGFTNRNIFGGCEIFTINGRGLIEIQNSFSGNAVNTRAFELSINSSLIFPKIVFPLTPTLRRQTYKYNPQTQILFAYTMVDRPQYKRINMQGSFRYNWQKSIHKNYQVTLAELNVNQTQRLNEDFRKYLQNLLVNGNTLYQSFSSSLVTSSSAVYTYNSNSATATTNKKSRYFQAFGEIGGSFVNNFLNVALDDGNPFGGLDTLPFYVFLRLKADLRNYYPMGKKGTLAVRYHAGVGLPFGNSKGTAVMPYEKYYFVGGSNSLRAWNPRRLGVGSFANYKDDGSTDFRFEQPGELLLETSFEVRQPLFSILEGAVFLDAGNVWMLNRDSREGSTFKPLEFWREIAVGTGVGIRADLSFLVVRIDLATKLLDPSRPQGQRFVGKNLSFKTPLGTAGQSILNIAIGYPF